MNFRIHFTFFFYFFLNKVEFHFVLKIIAKFYCNSYCKINHAYSLLNCKKVKVSERNRTIMVLFKIEEIQDGWSETRQISRTCKFSDSIIHSTQLKIDFSSTRAFLNSRKGLVTICVPLIGIDDSESKEIRVYTSKG